MSGFQNFFILSKNKWDAIRSFFTNPARPIVAPLTKPTDEESQIAKGEEKENESQKSRKPPSATLTINRSADNVKIEHEKNSPSSSTWIENQVYPEKSASSLKSESFILQPQQLLLAENDKINKKLSGKKNSEEQIPTNNSNVEEMENPKRSKVSTKNPYPNNQQRDQQYPDSKTQEMTQPHDLQPISSPELIPWSSSDASPKQSKKDKCLDRKVCHNNASNDYQHDQEKEPIQDSNSSSNQEAQNMENHQKIENANVADQERQQGKRSSPTTVSKDKKNKNYQYEEPNQNQNVLPETTPRGTIANREASKDAKNHTAELSISATKEEKAEEIDHEFVEHSMANLEVIQQRIKDHAKEIDEFEGISSSDREYYYLEEVLMRNLIKLDNIETKNNETVRQERKKAIKLLQKILKKLDDKLKDNQRKVEESIQKGTCEGIQEDNLIVYEDVKPEKQEQEVERY